MRPPEFTGGNERFRVLHQTADADASMRPPEFTGGNTRLPAHRRHRSRRFNEAAGIHRRKQRFPPAGVKPFHQGFNEAAGIHRRKLGDADQVEAAHVASMRPPEFTGGNPSQNITSPPDTACFNEAAGIHRRKLRDRRQVAAAQPSLQ